MASTDLNIGMGGAPRPSSRVLKPPGGGHTNIFGESEVAVNAPRPKYNQQNSSNLIACIGSTDPNVVVEKLREEISSSSSTTTNGKATNNEGSTNQMKSKAATNGNNNIIANDNATNPVIMNTRGARVPPGGFSSGGFW